MINTFITLMQKSTYIVIFDILILNEFTTAMIL